MRRYVTAPSPVDGAYYSRLLGNHFGGTVALGDGPGGPIPPPCWCAAPATSRWSTPRLLPTSVTAHPVGTIMAVADRAGDIFASRWS